MRDKKTEAARIKMITIFLFVGIPSVISFSIIVFQNLTKDVMDDRKAIQILETQLDENSDSFLELASSISNLRPIPEIASKISTYDGKWEFYEEVYNYKKKTFIQGTSKNIVVNANQIEHFRSLFDQVNIKSAVLYNNGWVKLDKLLVSELRGYYYQIVYAESLTDSLPFLLQDYYIGSDIDSNSLWIYPIDKNWGVIKFPKQR